MQSKCLNLYNISWPPGTLVVKIMLALRCLYLHSSCPKRIWSSLVKKYFIYWHGALRKIGKGIGGTNSSKRCPAYLAWLRPYIWSLALSVALMATRNSQPQQHHILTSKDHSASLDYADNRPRTFTPSVVGQAPITKNYKAIKRKEKAGKETSGFHSGRADLKM